MRWLSTLTLMNDGYDDYSKKHMIGKGQGKGGK